MEKLEDYKEVLIEVVGHSTLSQNFRSNRKGEMIFNWW